MKIVKFYSRWHVVPTHKQLMTRVKPALLKAPPLLFRSNKPLAMNTEEPLNILTYHHLLQAGS